MSLVFSQSQVKSVFNGTKTVALRGPEMCDLVLLEIKQEKYVNVF